MLLVPFIWSWAILFTGQKQAQMKLSLQMISLWRDLPEPNGCHAVTQQSSCLCAALEISMLKADIKAFKPICSSLQKMKLQLPHIFQLKAGSSHPDSQSCRKGISAWKFIFGASKYILHVTFCTENAASWICTAKNQNPFHKVRKRCLCLPSAFTNYKRCCNFCASFKPMRIKWALINLYIDILYKVFNL